MICPAAICRAALPVEPVTFSVDLDADAGNVIPALAMLLIGIDRRRRERAAEDDEQDGDHNPIGARQCKDC